MNTTVTKVHEAARQQRNVYCVAYNTKGYHRVRVTVRGEEFTFDTNPSGTWFSAYQTGWGGTDHSSYPHQVTDREFIELLEQAVQRRANRR